MRHEGRPALGICALVAAATLASACEVNLNSEGLTARETRNFKLTGQPEVVLDTFDGAIEIHSWDRDEVEVEIEKRAMEQSQIDEIKIHAEQNGNRIELRGFGVFIVKPRKRGVGRNPRTGTEVPIPAGKTIRFKPGKELTEKAVKA